ncbi:uncharacterized protein A4U43_C09F13160 [Asparagus officinalis]|uniref:Uncharacterized protein n=1 Tax=Asparagus officinalis TaxID=4686 RepID=A0A5P1E751_ASPOF|nr:uncharacterized protein A4U43_C09F13160 [Asparagus officinalis]
MVAVTWRLEGVELTDWMGVELGMMIGWHSVVESDGNDDTTETVWRIEVVGGGVMMMKQQRGDGALWIMRGSCAMRGEESSEEDARLRLGCSGGDDDVASEL